jgi:anti-sigma regulatory factor (Ser/Thr protein kinase)
MSDPGAAPDPVGDSPVARGARTFRLELAHGVPAATARRAAVRVLQEWGLSRLADDAALVITEMVQNVTLHTTSACELRLTAHGEAVLIEVTDSSPRPPMQRPQDLRSAGGRGLLLIAAVAQRWGHRPTAHTDPPGKVVWAELGDSGFPETGVH